MEGTATLSWHLFLDCNCGETLDLSDEDHDIHNDYLVSKAIFYNKWDDLIGEEFICPKCGNPVIIEKVEC